MYIEQQSAGSGRVQRVRWHKSESRHWNSLAGCGPYAHASPERSTQVSRRPQAGHIERRARTGLIAARCRRFTAAWPAGRGPPPLESHCRPARVGSADSTAAAIGSLPQEGSCFLLGKKPASRNNCPPPRLLAGRLDSAPGGRARPAGGIAHILGLAELVGNRGAAQGTAVGLSWTWSRQRRPERWRRRR